MNGIDVLIVDDSPDLRELIEMVIDSSGLGWRVVATAAEGRSAIQEAQVHQPDLVLLDNAMPVMDGMAALPQIREVAPEATVVMLSAFPSGTAAQSALQAGAHGYIEKSGLVSELVKTLVAILRDRERL